MSPFESAKASPLMAPGFPFRGEGHVPFGREPETRLLEAALDRAVRGGMELVFIRGESGIGKTALVASLRPVFRSRGLFGSGKFQPGSGQEPRFALMEAIRGVIRNVLLLPERELARRRSSLQNALEGLGGVLLPSLPELFHIIGPQSDPPALGPMESQHRFKFIFGRMLETLGGDNPLVLFLDDLQWADTASLDLLKGWIIDRSAKRGVFLLAAFRAPAKGDLIHFLADLDAGGNPPAYLDLNPLDAEAVKAWVGAVFENEDGAAQLGKAILESTHGHPFHIHQYLEALRRHRYADIEPSSDRLVLRFRNSTLSEDVAPSRHLLSLTLANLSQRARECLETAACVGFVFPTGLVASVVGCTASELTGMLDEAIRLGLVTVPAVESKAGSSEYAFTHDQVMEALLGGIASDRAEALHFGLGISLLQSLKNPTESIFAICGHLNQARALILGSVHQMRTVELNLLAGRKAKASAAFAEAFGFFKAGLALLPADSWNAGYATTLALHLEATETAFMSGDFDAMDAFIRTTETHARDFLDFTPAGEILIQSLTSRHRLDESIEYGLSMLSRFGLVFPKNPGKGSALLAILSTEWALLGRSFRELEEQPLAVDPDKLAMARIMGHLNASVFLSRPQLHPLILIAQLKLSLRHGVNRITPFVYGIYGFIQCGALHRYKRGLRFAQLALKLLESHKAEESTAKALFVVNHFVHPWSRPLAETLPGLKEGLTGALKSGDLEFAGYLANVSGMHLYHSGANLGKLKEIMLEHRSLISGLKHGRALLTQDLYLLNVENLLQPRPLEPSSPVSKAMCEKFASGGDVHGIAFWHLNRLILAVNAGDSASALAAGAEVGQRLDSFTGLFFTGWYYFYEALAISGLERVDGRHRRRFDNHAGKVRSFARQCPGNYRHKNHLLAAEAHRMDNRPMKAREEYTLAIESARESKAMDEEALAWERLFLFHHNRKEAGFACMHLGEYLACLRRWGAEARVTQVTARFKTAYPNACRDSAGFTGNNPDFGKILAVSQSIALEMDLDKLMVTLMEAIADLTGAGRVCLVSTAAEGFGILAEKGESRTRVQTVGLQEKLPASVLVFVTRTGQAVNLADAESDEHFGADPYFKSHQCKSVLCFPLKSQGKTEALLYLENPQAEGAFSEKDPWTEWVGGQAAISLRNAQYHRQRMSALKARINPHFLFNALTSISETILHEPKDAVRGVAKLSKLYRYQLESSDRDLVPLDRELEFVDVYVSIEQLRFGKRLHYQKDIAMGLGDLLIPPLTVQPLVENAIKHGLAAKPGNGTVTLDVRVQGGYCRISISDDGVGWGGGKPGIGEGHRNIMERLCLAFGDLAKLEFADSWSAGTAGSKMTEAIIWIPLQKVGLSSRPA